MLKTRIIPILLVQKSSIIKTVNFGNSRIVGDALSTAKVFSQRMADEMMILDIDATRTGNINFSLLERISKFCNMPLTLGGGIKNLEDADQLFKSGADKVVINSEYYNNRKIINDLSKKYGKQSIVFSLDVKKIEGQYYGYSNSGFTFNKVLASDIALDVVSLGAGEILLNNIDKDGKMQGYDLELIKNISEKVQLPVIAAGGCGSKEDCYNAINSGANAIAAGSIFFWIGESIISIKEYLYKKQIKVRLI